MEITAKAIFDFFKGEDEQLQQTVQAQHDMWVQYKEDLVSGRKVIDPKDMPFVLDKVNGANKAYNNILDLEKNFQESRTKKIKKINEDQKSLKELVLDTEKRMGDNCFTKHPLFKCLLGIGFDEKGNRV